MFGPGLEQPDDLATAFAEASEAWRRTGYLRVLIDAAEVRLADDTPAPEIGAHVDLVIDRLAFDASSRSRIAEAVDIPQILYNVPGRTACDMLPETVARLSQIENIIGIKDATGDLSRVALHQALCREGFELYSGDDATTVDFIVLGGLGCISVTANIAPAPMHEMLMAALDGDVDKAREIDAGLKPLHRDLFIEANPIPVKWALHEMGMVSPAIRLPLTPLSASCRDRLRQSMRESGVLSA
jgi:4-hydroxy-tetrahydrodipicolinate synthase